MHRFLRLMPAVLLMATLISRPPLRALAPSLALADEAATAEDDSQAVTTAQDDDNRQPVQGTQPLYRVPRRSTPVSHSA